MKWLKEQIQWDPSPLCSQGRVDVDFKLLGACLFLLGLGWVMMTSASTEIVSQTPWHYMIRHGIYLFLGGFLALFVMVIPLAFWQRHSNTLLIVGFLLLGAALLPGIGHKVNGASRWIGFGLFNIQPSELAKIISVFYLAAYMVRRQTQVQKTWSGFLLPIFCLLPNGVLLLMEPDLGATVVLFGAVCGMLFLGGVQIHRFLVLIILAAVSVFFLIQAQPYRLARLTNYSDPWLDPYGSGYQLSQALISFGRGEFWGLGLGDSIQKQFFLPEAHTDFVFSILAEELGLFGALITVVLFAWVGLRALYVGWSAQKNQQLFSAYVAYGLALLWIGQIIINLGVNTGLLPTKGLTLPFMSYGGSSLIVCVASLGLLLRIEWESRRWLGNSEFEFQESDFKDRQNLKKALASKTPFGFKARLNTNAHAHLDNSVEPYVR